MAKKQFKAESKRLLDLMINSIYTHKEIFLRELISNASDALDKLYYLSLTENTGISRDDFSIRLTANKEARTLTILDNGIGMTKEELENNLGTIAKSGSLQFKSENAGKIDPKEEIDIIGQFGVGFYSAFMVASKIEVRSKKYGESQAYLWQSEGVDGYTVTECEKDGAGTEITLYIKDDTEDEKYDDYLNEYKIKGLVKKYSDYVRYPIKMKLEKHRMKPATEEQMAEENFTPEYETYMEDETLNSMVPIWKKSKGNITEEEYNQFYTDKFFDWEAPAKVIHTNVEGVTTYNALMYIPSKAPYNYYTKDYEKGLQLYSSGVLIMDKCADLLPDYFSFVKGLVDSQDLSLNISREMLQHDRQLKAIAVRLEKKIKAELLEMQAKDREKYEKFFENFGLQLKFGAYDQFGMNKDNVKELLMYYSSSEKKLVTFAEYISRMKEDQKYIYYACGESIEKLDKQPQTEMLKDKGYEILYCTDEIDEFAIKVLAEIDEKQFKSVSSEDLGIEETAEEKEAKEKQAEENKDLLEAMKEALDGKVSEVRVSQRLKSHPVCLTANGEISIEMEKVLNAMPNSDKKVKAEKILEISANHKVLDKLITLYAEDKEALKKYSLVLYEQARVLEGLPLEDVSAYVLATFDII